VRNIHLRPGYVRKNGAPYSKNAVVTEYYDLNTMPNGDQWLTVTTKVDDPLYFSRALLNEFGFQKASQRQWVESHPVLGKVN